MTFFSGRWPIRLGGLSSNDRAAKKSAEIHDARPDHTWGEKPTIIETAAISPVRPFEKWGFDGRCAFWRIEPTHSSPVKERAALKNRFGNIRPNVHDATMPWADDVPPRVSGL